MDYEKAYREALAKARELYNDEQTHVGMTPIHLTEIFPELKESEDERIRKWLIGYFQRNKVAEVIKTHDILAWLEKQGRKKSDPRYENLEELLAADDIYQMSMNDKMVQEAKEKAVNALSEMCIWRLLGLEKQDNNNNPNWKPSKEQISALEHFVRSIEESGYASPYDSNTKLLNSLINDLYELEKQGEQNPTDKVAPKFHEGDWCIDNEDGVIFQIVKVLDNTYTYKTNEGKEYSCTHYSLENDAKLWSIEDAKEGDILATTSGAFIYNGNRGGGGCPGSYCGINTLGKFQTGVETHWTEKKVYPATKEQRDILMKAMTDAGYKWDAEKKELKLLITNGGDFFESENCKQNPAWSEDDEHTLQGVIDEIQANKNQAPDYDFETYDRFLSWLKSLKQRIGGYSYESKKG